MKILHSIMFMALTFTAFGQASVVQPKGDSLVVLDKNMVTDLFGFGDAPLQKLTLNTQPKPAVERQPVRNLHDNTHIDTAYRVAFEKDIFIALKFFDGKTRLIHADVESGTFGIRQGIHVGMTKDEVRKVLAAYSLTSIPRYLVLRDRDTSDCVILYFKGEALVFMEYFAPAR